MQWRCCIAVTGWAALIGWTEPRPLPGVPSNQLIRWPVVATRRDTLFVAANLFPIRGDTVAHRPVLLARLPGGPIEPPSGDFQFVHPKIIAAANGDIHLVWAEFASKAANVAEWVGAAQGTLWHAALRNGRWSDPEVAYRSSSLRWTRDDGHLAVDAAGALHAVLWSLEESFAGIVHLRRDGSGWRARTLGPGTLNPAAAVHAAGDSITVAYFGNSADSSDHAGVTLVQSANRGESWGSARVIRRLRGRGASHPQFARTRDRLALVWAESRSGLPSIDTLRVATLRGDSAPGAIIAISLPPGAAWFSLAATPCGQMTVLAGTLSLQPRTHEIALGARGEVSRRPFVGDDRLATFAGAGATSRGFTALLAIRPAPGTPVQVAVVSRPAC